MKISISLSPLRLLCLLCWGASFTQGQDVAEPTAEAERLSNPSAELQLQSSAPNGEEPMIEAEVAEIKRALTETETLEEGERIVAEALEMQVPLNQLRSVARAAAQSNPLLLDLSILKISDLEELSEQPAAAAEASSEATDSADEVVAEESPIPPQPEVSDQGAGDAVSEAEARAASTEAIAPAQAVSQAEPSEPAVPAIQPLSPAQLSPLVGGSTVTRGDGHIPVEATPSSNTGSTYN